MGGSDASWAISGLRPSGSTRQTKRETELNGDRLMNISYKISNLEDLAAKAFETFADRASVKADNATFTCDRHQASGREAANIIRNTQFKAEN
jgi:hypothetical protein